jgi:yeast amino acid transporter
MLLFTVQALGEMAVLYPVNGAFYSYTCRFLDPAWYVTFRDIVWAGVN